MSGGERVLSAAQRRRLTRREAFAGDRLPYVRHIDPATVLMADGGLMQVIALRGMAHETADAGELNYRKDVRDTMLRSLAGGRFALTHHIVRRLAAPRVDGVFETPFARAVDAGWTRRLETRRLFVNELYLCIVRKSAAAKGGVLDWVLNRAAAPDPAGRARERRELDAARESIVASLEPYGARLLTTYTTFEGVKSEPLEFLGLLYNGDFAEVASVDDAAGRALTRRRVSFGENAIEFFAATRLERTFAAMIAVKEYPPFTQPGQFDSILALPHEMALTQSFAPVDRQAALDRIDLALRRMRAADDAAVSLRQDLARAKDDVAAGRSSFGEHHLSVMVKADSLPALDETVAETIAAFNELGAIAVREDVAMEPSYWSQFPGNFADIARRSLVSSANMASMASLHNHPIGQADGNTWGPAIAVLETTAASPYFFNFHVGDLGNFLIIGPSGSGKTVVLNFLLAQAEKIKPRIVLFDKDRSGEIFLRAMGGRYDVLRPGVATAFNPLLLPDTPANRRFLQAFITRLLFNTGENPSADDAALIANAVAANYDQEPALRRLRYFRELFAGARRPTAGDLASRFAPWVGEGDRAWLFDNEHDRLDLSTRIVGVDMTQILDDPGLRTPAMMYLFHRVEERLDGAPSIIVVDEGWKALDDDIFVARIRDWEKTIRKRNGIVGLATQSASDALDSRIASAIIEQSATQIFMPNPKAQERDYRSGFGLSAHEFDLIRTLPDTSRCFLVRQGRESVVVRLNLNGLGELLTVLSGREKTVRILDDLRATLGDDPGVWLSALLERAR